MWYRQTGSDQRRRPGRRWLGRPAYDGHVPDDVSKEHADRRAAARREVEASALQSDTSGPPLLATRQSHAGRACRDVLHGSAYDRLIARLESQPVIEQAKGILMAQLGCTAEDAFDMLRVESQRSNIPVRDIARQVVDRGASPEDGQARRYAGPCSQPAADGLDG
jgi:hypothetical protein